MRYLGAVHNAFYTLSDYPRGKTRRVYAARDFIQYNFINRVFYLFGFEEDVGKAGAHSEAGKKTHAPKAPVFIETGKDGYFGLYNSNHFIGTRFGRAV